MIEQVQIEEVLGRSSQGITLPFLCRGIDEHQYYVKGRGAGRRSQICELLAGQLAAAFGLATAEFAVVDVPEELIVPAIRADLTELGAGLAFGSRVLPHVQELSVSHLVFAYEAERVEERLAMDVFMFDWWIRNADRILTPYGGNPNLLWDCETESLVVIDHNQAFDRDFDPASFSETHVFSDIGGRVFGDMVERAQYHKRFERAMARFDKACDNVPATWWWQDHDVPADFDVKEARAMLARFEDDEFWRNPR